MNPAKNVIPDNVVSIHLVAACGTGMAALAAMLKDLGYQVTGSDKMVYPPMSDFLAEKGIPISDGFSKDNLSHMPDLVIIGNAVTHDNPEALATRENGFFYCSMPQALNHFGAAGKKTIVIAGTHGKTTTSSLMAWMLQEAGLDPGFMIGGIVKNFRSNYRLGRGEYFVIEGDEYDTAFFDKGSKFLHFTPSIAILTSIEFDHADIFKDFNHVKSAFKNFLGRIPDTGSLIAYGEDETVVELYSKHADYRVSTYGTSEKLEWRVMDIVVEPPWNKFKVMKKGMIFGSFKTRLMGRHNLMNAASVIAAADSIGIPVDKIAQALETFESVKRRQEIRGVRKGITVMDDFAHHPTAVSETIRAVKPFYPNGRVIAVFEPRTNSSMRNIFQDIYPESFERADLICIREPSRLDKIDPSERFSAEKLVEDLIARNKEAHYFHDTDEILDFLPGKAESGDLILIMSNGGFDNIHHRLLKLL